MNTHPNLATLKNLYEGDRVLFFERLGAQYICHTPGKSQIAGTFVGPEGMKQHGMQMQALTGGTFRVRLLGDILIDDTYAMAPVMVSATRMVGTTQRELRVRAFGVWRFEGETVVEHWECPVDMDAFDAFWADQG